jgi:hypothetical protein
LNPNANRQIKLYEDGTIIISPIHKSKYIDISERYQRKKILTERGNIKKTYSLTNANKRLIRCSAIRLFHTRKNSIKFFTLTFSKKISQSNANICLSKFLENLKKNYHANNYIVVKENHKSGNPHYHCLIDIPYTNFKILNNSWCIACKPFVPYSYNALTSGNKKIINDVRGVANYVTKYVSKASNTDIALHETRIFFITHSCLSKSRIIDMDEYVYLTSKFGLKKLKIDGKLTYCIEKEYCMFLFLKNFAFLPEMFEIKIKKRQKIPKKDLFHSKNDCEIQANLNF